MQGKKKYTFSKRQHICGQVRIDILRAKQQRLRAFPVLGGFSVAQEGNRPRIQALIIAPKKVFHHAVDRNRAKRLLREALRLEIPAREEVLKQKDLYIDFTLVAVGYMENFAVAQKCVAALFAKMEKQLSLADDEMEENS